jgi:hypothetical protein
MTTVGRMVNLVALAALLALPATAAAFVEREPAFMRHDTFAITLRIPVGGKTTVVCQIARLDETQPCNELASAQTHEHSVAREGLQAAHLRDRIHRALGAVAAVLRAAVLKHLPVIMPWIRIAN